MKLAPRDEHYLLFRRRRGDQRIAPPGDNFSPRGQSSLLGDNFGPGGQSFPPRGEVKYGSLAQSPKLTGSVRVRRRRRGRRRVALLPVLLLLLLLAFLLLVAAFALGGRPPLRPVLVRFVSAVNKI
jgi:hypothetical protein